MARDLSREEIERGETLARAITDGLNTYGHDSVIQATCKALSNSHRTLQQTFTMLCFAWIRYLAKLETYQFDGRNEASVKAARKIVAEFDTDMALPFI
jgi:hypothetical protein